MEERPEEEDDFQKDKAKNLVNLETPFVVTRMYQNRMITKKTRKIWQEKFKGVDINRFAAEQVEQLYKQ